MTIQEMKIGDSASTVKTIGESDVYLFAGITGDLNPAHVNEQASSQTSFGGRIAHGILSAGFISAVLAMKLPGPGTIYLGQELKFTKPVRFGDTVTATATVSHPNVRSKAAPPRRLSCSAWLRRVWLPSAVTAVMHHPPWPFSTYTVCDSVPSPNVTVSADSSMPPAHGSVAPSSSLHAAARQRKPVK